MKFIKKFILRLVFSKEECKYYAMAIDLEYGKSKKFAAMKILADEKHRSDGKRYYVINGIKDDGFIDFAII